MFESEFAPVPTKCPVSARGARQGQGGVARRFGVAGAARRTEDEDAAPRLRERELDGGEARRGVKRAAAPARDQAHVERERHARALRGHRLGDRDDVDEPRHVVQKLAVRRQRVVLRVAREGHELLVGDAAAAVAAVAVGVALALPFGAARVDAAGEELGQRRRVGGALRLLRFAAEAVLEVDGGVDVGAHAAQLLGVRHRARARRRANGARFARRS